MLKKCNNLVDVDLALNKVRFSKLHVIQLSSQFLNFFFLGGAGSFLNLDTICYWFSRNKGI